MPWHKNYDPTRVLESAMKAFWAHGYEATSMNDLVKATGINRGSIYSAFTNKHALFLSTLRHYDTIYRVQHLQRTAEECTPLEAIITVFESAARKPADKTTPWGCLLVNTALELSPHDREIAEFIENSFLGVEAFFFARIKAAKCDGTVKSSLDSRATAQTLLCLFMGLRVLTRADTRQSTIDAITSQVRMMLV